MRNYRIEAHITPWPEGGYLAEAVGLQGCWVVADTIDEAIADLREVAELWIRSSVEHGWPVPPAAERLTAS